MRDIDVRNKSAPGMYADGQGLYLRVEPTGGKRWFLRIMKDLKRHDLGLGGYPLVSLSEARAKARELRKVAKDGGNFMKVHHKDRNVVTFEAVAREIHAKRAGQWKNPKHAAQWLSTLETYAFPQIGARSIEAIEQRDCAKVLSAIWTTKPETARRVRQRLKLVFDWAKVHGHRVGDNPILGIELGLADQTDKVKNHAALPYKKMAEFMTALGAAKASTGGKFGLEFLILTALRDKEVRLVTWSEIDLTARTLTIPASRMKADKEHVVPLSDRCMAILAEVRAAQPSVAYVFQGRRAGKPLSENTFAKLARDQGFGHLTAHGFRSTFKDWASEVSSFANEVSEMALAHAIDSKVEASYRRGDLLDKRRDLMEAWADYASGKAPGGIIDLDAHRKAG
jgi:integrase